MDEVDFLRAYNNTRVLIDSARETDNPTEFITHICNAQLTMLAMLDSLNQRVTEMQAEEDDC